MEDFLITGKLSTAENGDILVARKCGDKVQQYRMHLKNRERTPAQKAHTERFRKARMQADNELNTNKEFWSDLYIRTEGILMNGKHYPTLRGYLVSWFLIMDRLDSQTKSGIK